MNGACTFWSSSLFYGWQSEALGMTASLEGSPGVLSCRRKTDIAIPSALDIALYKIIG
jgi:hypothetical protein